MARRNEVALFSGLFWEFLIAGLNFDAFDLFYFPGLEVAASVTRISI